MKKDLERREYPKEMVEACGFAPIPNPVLWKELLLSCHGRHVLIYMLAQPIDWIFYESKIREATGISKSTINKVLNTELNKYIDKKYVGTGKYGNGFVVSFSKLYNECISLGLKKKEERSKENEISLQLKQFVRDANSIVLIKDDDVRETITTNTTINTETNNTNKKYYYTNETGSSDFQSLGELEDASPCGSRQIFNKEETDSPVEETNLPVEEDDDEYLDKIVNDMLNEPSANHQTDEQRDSEKYANHIVNTLFGTKHYAPNVKEKYRLALIRKPASELNMVIANHTKWENWCQNISRDQGVIKAQDSDYGLPLLANDFIYSKYTKYLYDEKSKKEITEKLEKEEKKRIENEEKRTNKIIKRKMFIENMPYDDKLNILKTFRFDYIDRYKRLIDVADIAKDNDLVGDNDYIVLYDILSQRFEDKYYHGRDVFIKRYNDLMALSNTDVIAKLDSFKFDKASLNIGVNSPEKIRNIAEQRHIKGDYDLVHQIVFNEFPTNYYVEKKEIIPSKEFEEELLRSLNEE